jgi:oligopeptide transport system ATP-binding protein
MSLLMAIKRLLVVVGGIAIVLGLVLPWVYIDVFGFSLHARLRGYDDLGLVTAFAGALIIALSFAQTPRRARWTGPLIVVLAAACGAVAAYRIADLQWARDIALSRTFVNGLGYETKVYPAMVQNAVTLASGLYVILVASLMAIVGGVLTTLKARNPALGAPKRREAEVASSQPVVITSTRRETAEVEGRPGVLLEVHNLKTYYPIYGGILRRRLGSVYAVDDVSMTIDRGEKFGLVGESGCGKTTFGRTILRLEKANAGSISMDGQDVLALRGRELKLMRRRMQLIFQDPYGSLNPRMPVSDLIGEGLLAQADDLNGWGRRDVRDKRVADYLEAVGLRRDYSRRYAHEFSGGQRQRIGIARALALDPEFIVCDEPVSALDVSIQSQILNLLSELRDQFNLTYLFIAHNLSVVQYFCDRIGVMYLGKLVEVADTDSLYDHPRHPYSVALLSAIPVPDPRVRKKRLVLKGDVPSPANPPTGCRFHPRCWLREKLDNPEICSTVDPELRDMGGGQFTACHFAERVSDQAAAEVAARQSVIDTLAIGG